jgi:beta-lactamase class A
MEKENSLAILQTMTRWLAVWVIGCGSAVIAARGQTAPAGSDATAPGPELRAIIDSHQGQVALYARQLNTGKTIAWHADDVVQTASVIKLGLLYEAMIEIREGKARWDEKITLPPGYAVGGSGFLQFFDGGDVFTLKDLLSLMVIVSDNSATDLVIDRFGVQPVDDRMQQLGLKNTWLYKRIGKPPVGKMPADQPKFGLGKTTPREMATLMETIGRCQLHPQGTAATPGAETFGPVDDQDRAICKVALHMLSSQFYRDTVPRYLDTVDTSEHGSGIASKTGSLNAVRNDVSIVAGKTGPIVLSIFTHDNKDQSWTVDNTAEIAIAKLAKLIVLGWSPAGIDDKYLLPGLDLEPGEAFAQK